MPILHYSRLEYSTLANPTLAFPTILHTGIWPVCTRIVYEYIRSTLFAVYERSSSLVNKGLNALYQYFYQLLYHCTVLIALSIDTGIVPVPVYI